MVCFLMKCSRRHNWLKCVLVPVVVEEKRERTLSNILSAKNKIRYEISELNDRLKASKESNAKLKAEIAKLESEERVEAAEIVTWLINLNLMERERVRERESERERERES